MSMNKDENLGLSKTLKKLRTMFGLTQNQIAMALNITRSAYAYYECGKATPKYDTLIDIAHIYNVTLDSLIYGEASPKLSASGQIYDDNSAEPTASESDISDKKTESFTNLSTFEQSVIMKLRLMPAEERDKFIQELYEL